MSESGWAGQRQRELWSSLPVVLLGLVIVSLAVIKLPWPPDQPTLLTGTTVSFVGRLRGQTVEVGLPAGHFKTVDWYARRLADGGMLGLTLAGYASVVLAVTLRPNRRRALLLLGLIGALGVAYCGLVGLYPGPIMAGGGFGLILWGAGLDLVSLGQPGQARRGITAKTAKTMSSQEWDSKSYDTHSAA